MSKIKELETKIENLEEEIESSSHLISRTLETKGITKEQIESCSDSNLELYNKLREVRELINEEIKTKKNLSTKIIRTIQVLLVLSLTVCFDIALEAPILGFCTASQLSIAFVALGEYKNMCDKDAEKLRRTQLSTTDYLEDIVKDNEKVSDELLNKKDEKAKEESIITKANEEIQKYIDTKEYKDIKDKELKDTMIRMLEDDLNIYNTDLETLLKEASKRVESSQIKKTLTSGVNND